MSDAKMITEEVAAQVAAEIAAGNTKVAELYTKPNCPYCVRAKNLLEQKGYTKFEVDALATRDILIERVTAETGNAPRTVPQIFINNEYVGGFDDLEAFFASQSEAN